VSLTLAFFTFAPGACSGLGCVGPIAALLALTAGMRGMRAARDLDGQGRKAAVAGMAAGGLGLVFGLAVIVTLTTISAQRSIQQIEQAAKAGKAAQTLQTVQSAGLHLTYPGSWQVIDISQVGACKQAGVECVVAIRHPSGDGTNINLMRFALQQEASVEQADQAVWEQFTSSTPDVNLESREATQVGSQPAIKRTFNVPAAKASGGRAYIYQVYIVKGLGLYQITVWTPSADALKQHQGEIDQIVSSIGFEL
jgi:hypothetical protein